MECCLPWAIVGGGAAIAAGIVWFGAYSLRIGEKGIFHSSGNPPAMAAMLLSSLHVTAQLLLGVLLVVTLSLLMIGKTITAEAGLPLLSAVAGYLLAKGFKEVGFPRHEKGRAEKE